MENAGSKPLSVTSRRLHSTKHPTCPCACNINGTVWTCSSGVARLIDNAAISSFQIHRTHHASFVSAPLTDPFLCLDLCRPPALWRGDFPQTRSLSAVLLHPPACDYSTTFQTIGSNKFGFFIGYIFLFSP